MKISTILFLFMVLLSGSGNASLQLDNLPDVYNYAKSTKKCDVKNCDSGQEEDKKSVVLPIPVTKSKDIENIGNKKTGESNGTEIRSRKVRCKGSTIFRKPRLSTMSKDSRKKNFISERTTTKRSVESLNKKENISKASGDGTKYYQNLRNSKVTKREDDDTMNEKFYLEPRPQDSVTLVGEKSVEPINNEPKNYICHCIEKNVETFEKPKKKLPTLKTKKKNESDIFSKKSEQAEKIDDCQKCSSVTTLRKESPSAKRWRRKPNDSSELPITKTISSSTISPYIFEPKTIPQPMRVDIPLNNNDVDSYESVYPANSRWPFEKNLQTTIQQREIPQETPLDERSNDLEDLQDQDCASSQQTSYGCYQRFGIGREVVYPTSYVPVYSSPQDEQYPLYTRYPEYDEALTSDEDIRRYKYSEAPFPGNQAYVPSMCDNYIAKILQKNFADINECIRLYGRHLCTPRISGGQVLGSNQREESRYTTAGLPRTKSIQLNYPMKVGNVDERVSSYDDGRTSGNGEESIYETVESPQGQSYQSQVVGPSSQNTPTNRLRFGNNIRHHTSTARYQPKSDIQDYTMNKYSPTTQNSDESRSYSEESKESEDNEIGTNVLKKIRTGIPRISTAETKPSFQAAHQITSSFSKDIPTTSSEEYVEDFSREDEKIFKNKETYDDNVATEDKTNFRKFVQKVTDNLRLTNSIFPNSKSKASGIDGDLALMRKIFCQPGGQNSALDNLQSAISDGNNLGQYDLSMHHRTHSELENAFENVVNHWLSPLNENSQQLSSTGMQANLQSAHTEDSLMQTLISYIGKLLENLGIGFEEIQSPIVQNIIFKTIEKYLRNYDLDVNDPVIWDSLQNIFYHPSSLKTFSTKKPSPNNQPFTHSSSEKSSSGLKNLPTIPVKEHVFKDGHWTEQDTFIGNKRKYFDSETSSETSLEKDGSAEEKITHTRFPNSNIHDNQEFITKYHATEPTIGITQTTAGAMSKGSKMTYPSDTTVERDDDVPIKYYSPADRVIAYLKNIQRPEAQSEEKSTIAFQSEKSSMEDSTVSLTSQFPSVGEDSESSMTSSEDSSSTESNENLENIRKTTAGIGRLKSLNGLFRKNYKEKAANKKIKSQIIVSGDDSSEEGISKVTKVAKIPNLPIEASLPNSIGAARSRGHDPGNPEVAEPGVSLSQKENFNDDKDSLSSKHQSNCAGHKYDPTYFGKIIINSEDPTGDKLSDLINTDLFYSGDGVKIPLMIKKMPDGSLGLSISDQICDNFIKRKCPCCVPNDGDIIEERRLPEEEASEEYNDKSTMTATGFTNQIARSILNHDPRARYTRSFAGNDVVATTTPVIHFAKKYNLTLDLSDQFNDSGSINDVENTDKEGFVESSKEVEILKLVEKDNASRKEDNETNQDQMTKDFSTENIFEGSNIVTKEKLIIDTNSGELIENRLEIKSLPKSKEVEMTVTPVDDVIHSTTSNPTEVEENPRKNEKPNVENNNYDLEAMATEMEKQSDQQDISVLETMRMIKKRQMEKRPYRYQQSIDHYTQGKVDVMTDILQWLKHIFLNITQNNDT